MNIDTFIASASAAVSGIAAAFSAVSAIAACRSARAAHLTYRHSLDREKPRASVCVVCDFERFDRSVVVANTGAVPFTVVEVGLGDSALSPDVRDVPPGGHARWRVPPCFDGSGPAYAVLAGDAVFREATGAQDE